MIPKLMSTVGIAFLLLASLLGLGFFWQYQRDQNALVLNHVEFEARLLTQVAQQESDKLRDELASILVHDRNAGTSDLFINQSSFQAVYIGEIESSGFKPKWQSVKSGWGSDVDPLIVEKNFQSIAWASVENGETVWSLGQDVKQTPFVIIASRFKEGFAAGFLPITIWSQFGNLTKVDVSEVLLVDAKGMALAYTQQEYVGASLAHHPLLGLMGTQGRVKGPGESLDGSKVLAVGMKVPGTNLRLVADQARVSGVLLFIKMVAISVFGIIASFLFFWGMSRYLVEPFEKAFAYVRQTLVDLAYQRPLQAPDADAPQMRGFADVYNRLKDQLYLRDPKSKEETEGMAYRQLSEGLSESLLPSLAHILAHSQLARSKSDSNDLKQHFIVIEREARKSKEVLDQLARLNDEKTEGGAKIDVRETVLAALAALKTQVAVSGAKVTKNMNQPVMAWGNPGRLRTAIEEILKNSTEALTGRPDPELKVTVQSSSDGKAQIEIEDNGAGIESDHLARVFDPFYGTKKSENNSGMGLTMAKAILKSLGGQIQLESSSGKGTKVLLEIPLEGSQEEQLETNSRRVMSPQSEATVDKKQSPGNPSDFSEVPLKTPEKKDPVDSLMGQKPIVGSKADTLPATPGDDEITFVGEVLAESTDPKILAETIRQEVADEKIELEEGVRIRPARIRGQT